MVTYLGSVVVPAWRTVIALTHDDVTLVGSVEMCPIVQTWAIAVQEDNGVNRSMNPCVSDPETSRSATRPGMRIPFVIVPGERIDPEIGHRASETYWVAIFLRCAPMTTR